jgi:CRP-like cAMP-binding protein
MPQSCLARNFSRYGELGARDVAFLTRFEERLEHYPAGVDVIVQGVPANHLFVLRSGWCFVKYDQPDGSRQVLDVCHGGDIVGMREVCFQRSINGMQTLTDAVLCPFPKAYLTEMFAHYPRLAGILFLAGMRREALLIERVVNLGRRSAFERLCHFVTEMKQRADHIADAEVAGFDVPIPASLLADILGMSEMHVYRMLKRMHEEHLASFDNGRFTLHDAAGLRKAARFRDDYLLLDRSWLPAG